MKKFATTLLLLFGLIIQHVQAQQSDCNNSLFVANNYYEAGKFSDALELLYSCFDSISRDEKAGAVRLMGICYQMLQNQEYAYGYAKLLLQLRPDYMKYPFADPKEFTAQLNKFEVVPKINWGLHFEVDQYAVRLIRLYTLAP
ncbi:MAG: hypothetical protein KDD94_06740, partial [Calditrichaeota bacterium]|nr:hypothetical protein [Calditrichota bacterium]